MNLFFPQWQGAGSRPDLLAVAKAMQAQLMAMGLKFETVDVLAEYPLTKTHGILGHAAILAQLQAAQALLRAQNVTKVFTLGGDCSVAAPAIAHLSRLYGEKLAVVWFDAHGDLNIPQDSPSAAFHGMPVRHLLGEGDAEIVSALACGLNPLQVLMPGVRELDAGEAAFIHERQLKIYPPVNFVAETLLADIAALGCDKIYLHLDLDCLEPKEFAFVGFPVADGLGIKQFSGIMRALTTQFELVGLSLPSYVEFDLQQHLPVLTELILAIQEQA
jgi:arginase